ncbi:MAG: hypothetical protein GY928_30525 [Colwellia sp.]|nr:hypothetical protein [Colwellia sp.]
MDEGKLCDELTVVIKSAMRELITDCNGYKSIVDNQKAKIAELEKQLKILKRLLFKVNKELDLYNCHELALDYIATQEKSDG